MNSLGKTLKVVAIALISVGLAGGQQPAKSTDSTPSSPATPDTQAAAATVIPKGNFKLIVGPPSVPVSSANSTNQFEQSLTFSAPIQSHARPAPAPFPLPPGYQPQADAAVQPFIGANLPANPVLNIDGLGNGVFPPFQITLTPPDTNGAVGQNQYVQAVNTSFVVLSKVDGHQIAAPVSIQSKFHGLGGPCDTGNFTGDPIVVYDKLANRWILSELAFNQDANGNAQAPFFE